MGDFRGATEVMRNRRSLPGLMFHQKFGLMQLSTFATLSDPRAEIATLLLHVRFNRHQRGARMTAIPNKGWPVGRWRQTPEYGCDLKG